jgi:hypothetical protein
LNRCAGSTKGLDYVYARNIAATALDVIAVLEPMTPSARYRNLLRLRPSPARAASGHNVIDGALERGKIEWFPQRRLCAVSRIYAV